MNGIQVKPSYLIKNGRKSNVKPTTTLPWWSQACEQPNARQKLWATRSWHNLWVTTSDVWKQNYLSGWIFKFDRRLSSWRGHTTSNNSSFPRILQQNLLQTNQEENIFHSFSQRSKLRSMQHESCESAMQKKSWRSGGQHWNCRKIWRCDNSRPRLHHRYAVVVQDLATQWAQSFPWKTKSPQETQRSFRQCLRPEEIPWSIYTTNSLEYIKTCEELIGIMRDLRRADLKQVELQNQLHAEWKKELRQYWFSLDCKKAGGHKPRSVSAISEMCKTH